LTWEYVIYNQRLASQQEGQRKLVVALHKEFRKSAEESGTLLTPYFETFLLGASEGRPQKERERVACRFATDAVCRMTEDEAVKAYHRLSGTATGSILDSVWHSGQPSTCSP